MRRTISILMLVFLLFPAAGTYLWLQWQQDQVRREIKHQIMKGMPDDELSRLAFTPDSYSKLEWTKAQEFEFKGDRYDVIRSSIEDGMVVLWCFHDKAESRIASQLQHLKDNWLQQDNQRRSNKEKVQHYYRNLFFQDVSRSITGRQPVFARFYSGKALLYYMLPSAPPGPPPRLI